MSGLYIQHLFLKYLRDDIPLFDVNEPIFLQNGISLLVAPSGSGKTTLFRMLCGWYSEETHPDIIQSSAIELNPYRDVMLVGNHASLLPWIRVLDNIAMKVPEVPVEQIIELTRILGLSEIILRAWPYELSLGMYKRIEFISAILSNKRLLLLDEFFASLDESLRAICFQLILERRSETQTTIISTHMPESLPSMTFPILQFHTKINGTITGLGAKE